MSNLPYINFQPYSPLPGNTATLYISPLLGGGASGIIGPATDTIFGTDNVAGILNTDTVADAVDKVETLLEKILPAAPPSLSTLTLTLADTVYSAFAAGTSTLFTNVQNNALQKPATVTIGPFYGANGGTLEAVIKDSGIAATINGTITLTSGNDAPVQNGYINLLTDANFDIYGVYKGLTAKVGGTAGAIALAPGSTPYTYALQHYTSGPISTTPTLTFYQDNSFSSVVVVDATSPGRGITSVISGGGTFVSGVPVLTTADSLEITFQVSNAIKKFYNATWTGRVSGSQVTTQTVLPTGVQRNEGSNPVFVVNAPIAAGAYNENVQVLCEGRNAAGNTVSQNAVGSPNPVRTDTLSIAASSGGFINEVNSGTVRRRPSGVGQYPAFSDIAFPSSTSIATNEELQLLGGQYRYPPSVDYSLTQPVGPNYTAVPAGSHNMMRWATFTLDTVTSVVFVIVTINGQVGSWGTTAVVSGLEMYARIDGATGWVNANDPYPGIGSPSANGDSALDIANSDQSIRRITFGLVPRSGLLVVRIGIPSGSDKRFIGVTRTSP